MFTPKEKEIIALLIKSELKQLEEEGQGVFIEEDYPDFISTEEKYKLFLKKLLKKLS